MALVEVGLYHDPLLAEMARGRLQSEGIEAVLFGAGLASLGLGLMAPARLMVDERDQDKAEALLSGL